MHENLRTQQLDVTAGAEAIAAKAGEAVAFWGRVDVLVNNAGAGWKGVVEEGGNQAKLNLALGVEECFDQREQAAEQRT